ncbi:alpha/beta hydrolase [Lacisediminihabitans profunda]|uniref:Alpha/beta hydrolase n=1 Tax=Lacisediminihabitans profunda TaxID=2594790 RepID=A0A5C8ULP4_9MICO|nr:alpha/beta hydrolase [Lacisediminihabitans profunda]TXN28373.1 alpha/beta hydrolase [Lacisediminihabitans profunda]
MLTTRRKGVRAVGIAAALVAATLVLSGCVPFGTSGGATTSKPTGEKVSAELQPYYSQVLRWKACGSQQCTFAKAPMDWKHPSASTDISLALTRASATGTRLGSLFVNPGGPGASGYDTVHDNLKFAVSATLRKSFDVIGWDPRGVGRSSAVKCYDDAGLDDYIYGLAKNPVNSPAWVAEVTTSATDLGAACLKNTGRLLDFVDTQSTVSDLDMLRAVVGDTKLNYLGYSYGSDIGMFYTDRFADRVGRVVLDGATDSTLSIFDVDLAQSKAFETALRHYLEDCPSTKNCPFTGSVDDSLAKISALYDHLTVSPLTAPDGRKLDNNLLSTAISSALYDKSSWPYLSDMFGEIRKGKTDTAFVLADFYNGRNSDGTYKDNSLVAFYAVMCLDYPVVTDPAEIARQNALLVAAAPTTTRPSVVGDVVCQNWPFHNRTPPSPVSGTGAAPILVLATTGDPATPYQWGVALSKQLQSAHLITRHGEGHTAYNRGIACVDGAVDRYFTTGVVPSSDPDCTG